MSVVEKTDAAVYCRLPDAVERYGLFNLVVVGKGGSEAVRLEIKKLPVAKLGFVNAIFRGRKPVWRDDISEILKDARYIVFYNPNDPAIMILWELED